MDSFRCCINCTNMSTMLQPFEEVDSKHPYYVVFKLNKLLRCKFRKSVIN